jgi:hypothetical protein
LINCSRVMVNAFPHDDGTYAWHQAGAETKSPANNPAARDRSRLTGK